MDLKKFSAKVHLGFLDLATLVLWGLNMFLSFQESALQTKYEFGARGDLQPGFFDNLSNIGSFLISSVCMMLLPVFIFQFKSNRSSGGNKIDGYELFILILLLAAAGACAAMGYMDVISALDAYTESVQLKGKTIEHFTEKPLRRMIGIAIIDILIGAMSVHEIRSHNQNIRRAASSGSTGSTPNASSTPPPTPSTVTPPPPFYNFIGKFKLNGGAAAITKVFSMPSSDSDLFKKSKLDSGQLGKICSDPTAVVEVMFNDSVASMDDMKVKLEAYGIDFSYVPN